MSNKNHQEVSLSEMAGPQYQERRKISRIELRTLRDAYSLKTPDLVPPTINSDLRTDLKRVTAYCKAESYRLKDLYKILKENPTKKTQMYFGECLYISYEAEDKQCYDLYFLHYGVVVMWGLEESEEQNLLKMITKVENNPYDLNTVEIENFMYGISKNSQIVNDKIYLSEENVHTKMVLSIAIAQSVKLDYFEELVDMTIETVKDLPDEVEKEGKVGKKRQDILKVMGRLHKLSFNLNLVSNILGEPEFVWEYSAFSALYEICIRYLDIKSRADLLNKRCEIIHGILEILSENITTYNSEKLEKTMTRLIAISVIFGAIQCSIMFFAILKYFGFLPGSK